nr:cytochrome P450 [Tanacetum cinerariifolium]
HHLPKLQYLDATIKETLRLHPISTLLVPRSSSQDCTVGGYTIPKGSTIFVNAWSIHRDPRYWDNPLDFNPERFLTNDGTNKWDLRGNNLNFLPFGSGKRVCPGIPLAEKMQMYILASLLHSFDWNLPKGEKHDLSDKFGALLTKRKPLIVIPSQRLSDIFNRINLSDIFPILAWFDLQGVERDIKEQLTKVDQIFTSMIEDRKKYNSINGVGHEGKKDFLQTLLELKDNEDGKSINIYQLKSLLMDIMIGGTDTVTTLIEWVMAEIIQHDKVMNRVHEELEEIVGLDNIVEEHHLPKLQYLDATIKETLRLHPISTLLVPRSSSQDCT